MLLEAISFTVETMAIVYENCMWLGISACFSVLILCVFILLVSLEKQILISMKRPI